MATRHDLVVIGAGPGGYVAALRSAQLGLDTACIEVDPRLGGTCLRIGCIPSKALLEASERYAEASHHLEGFGIHVDGVRLDLAAMMKHKSDAVGTLTRGVDGLFSKKGVRRYRGRGRLTGPGRVVIEGEDAGEVEAEHIILATGSVSSPLRGVELDGDRVGTSTEALAYPEVPGHLVVIGAGVIGLELGSVWARLGAKVTVLEYLDRILPGVEPDIARETAKIFASQGLIFELGQRVTGARRVGQGCVVERDGAQTLACDRVLLATGRRPFTEGLGLDVVGIETDGQGRIPVGEGFVTKAAGIYAIGDVIRGPMLAHKAEEEGIACVERIVTGYGHVDYDAIPSVVYTDPEVAWVGATSDVLDERGVPYRSGTFPFTANGRARAMRRTGGKVKVLAHAETDRILGVHIVGPRAGDLIAEAATAMSFGASAEDLARTCHAHPTLAEALKEAALGVGGRTLHL